MPRSINLRCEPDLRRALEAHAAKLGVSISEAGRRALRQGLGMSAREAGYQEGKLAGVRAVKRTLAEMLPTLEAHAER